MTLTSIGQLVQPGPYSQAIPCALASFHISLKLYGHPAATLAAREISAILARVHMASARTAQVETSLLYRPYYLAQHSASWGPLALNR